jgi:hypothetical protein
MIPRLLLIASSIALLAALAPEPVFASGSMRCGSHLVSAGQRHGPMKYEVLKKCGEPTDRYGNTWIYEKGGKTYTATFDQGGRLERID